MPAPQDSLTRLAEQLRHACVQAALEGYENAAMSGLCHEGAWEAAISAIRMADLETILRQDPSQASES